MRCTSYLPAYLAPVALLADAHPDGFTLSTAIAAGILAPVTAKPDANAPDRIDVRALPRARRYPFATARDGNGRVSTLRLRDTGMRDAHSGETLFTVA